MTILSKVEFYLQEKLIQIIIYIYMKVVDFDYEIGTRFIN